MNRVFFTAVFLMLLSIPSAFAQTEATVNVVIDSIAQSVGKAHVAVFNGKENYKNSVPFKTAVKNISGNRATVSFKLPVNNYYAIALFQDLNGNDSLDYRGSMKIPVEPFGFSNNKTGTFGPPAYKKISFLVTSDTTLIIDIIIGEKNFLMKNH